ncbi:MAG: IclR family transcriptional regulator [bacterium]
MTSGRLPVRPTRLSATQRPRERRRKRRTEYIVQGVFKALDILEAFTPGQVKLGTLEIAALLGQPRETTLHYLKTLERRAYLEYAPDSGTYSLGIKTFEFANVFLHHLRLEREARPFLQRLAAESDETAYVAVRVGNSVNYLQACEASRPVRFVPRIGRPIPAQATAGGKIHLAFGALGGLEQVVSTIPLLPLTTKTITDRAALLDSLQASVESGYAVDDQETEMGVRCVAAPVFDHTSLTVAAMGLSGPAERLPMERIKGELASLVMEMGRRLSIRLGYSRTYRGIES